MKKIQILSQSVLLTMIRLLGNELCKADYILTGARKGKGGFVEYRNICDKCGAKCWKLSTLKYKEFSKNQKAYVKSLDMQLKRLKSLVKIKKGVYKYKKEA